MAVFGYSADQFNADNCTIYGAGAANLYGTYFGLLNPGSITSKYYASPVSSGADATLFISTNTQFMCGTGPALFVDGFDQVTGTGNYTNVNTVYNQNGTGHTQGMLRIRSTPPSFGQRFTTLTWQGCRFEDQGVNHLPGSPTVVVTGSIAPNADSMTSTLTVTGTTTGAMAVGQMISGTGVAVATTVLANVSANVWTVTNSQTVASTTISSYYISSPAIYVVDYVYESSFIGWFNTAGAGLFGGPGTHVNTVSQVGNNGAAPCFNNAGTLIGGKFHFSGGPNNLGLFDQTASRGYALGGRVGSTEANVYAACAATLGELSDLNSDSNLGYARRLRSDTRVFFPTSVTPTNFALGWRGSPAPVNTSAYTGGSGLQQVATVQFNYAGMYWDGISYSQLAYPSAVLTLHGGFPATWAAAGEMKFVAQQTVAGTTYNVTLIDVTGIAAYGASTAWKLTVDMGSLSASSQYAWVYFDVYGTTPMRVANYVSLSGANFNPQTGGLVSVLVSMLNANNVAAYGIGSSFTGT
jgi:hypothetical protein